MSQPSSNLEQPRESWKSRVGFMMAAAGSAIGLANIWKFPYVVGTNGGGAFILVYLICTLLIGFPVLIAETLIGRSTKQSPRLAFQKLGGKFFGVFGALIVFTGLLVSAFYSAVAAWILGYLVEAFRGNLHEFTEASAAVSHYDALMASPAWGIGFHLIFIAVCFFVLVRGVRSGLELGNKIMMPLLFLILILISAKGLLLPGAWEGLQFVFKPDFSALGPSAFLVALGQSFFTLSAGQGTMITYGSYLSKDDNLTKTCLPVVLADTFIALLACVAVFSIVFATGMEPSAGPGLLFHTLPMVFSKLTGGYFFAITFFLLVTLAAISSEISAMEVVVAYFVDAWGWSREKAVKATAALAFLIGVPSALSFSLLSGWEPLGFPVVFFMDYLCTGFLIPLGGFLAVICVGWVWGFSAAFEQLREGSGDFFEKNAFLKTYLAVTVKYLAPALIIVVFLAALGVF